MIDFPLIRSLTNPENKTPLPKGHKYAEYKVVVEGEKIMVYIPIKECETFEGVLEEVEEMDKYDFNKIMRKVRGIRG